MSALPAMWAAAVQPTSADAVSVRYAREQYAIGYLQGRQEATCDPDAAEFARFYSARCDRAGRLVDVAEAYRQWRAQAEAAQLELFTE